MAQRTVANTWAFIQQNEQLKLSGLKRNLDQHALWPWRVALKGEQPEAFMAHPKVVASLRTRLAAS